MAWVSTKLQQILSYSMDLRTERQATEYYLVVFDAPATPIQAETATGVPKAGDPHPDDPTRLFKQKRPQCLDNANRTHWQVQVDYSSFVDTEPNPLLRPAQIAWDYSEGTEPYFRDHASLYEGAKDGYDNPVTKDQKATNTAGEPLATEREAGTWSATYTKNVVPSFTIASEVKNMQVVNSDPFRFDGENVLPYVAKISGGSLSAVQTENGVMFRVLTYKLKFKGGGWIDYLANVGLQELGPGGKRYSIMAPATADRPAEPTQLPWPLDELGVAYADPTVTPDELTFYPYVPISFASLGFS